VALAPGTRIGPYEIGPPLGAGGMGEVYRATDTALDRQVAIKVLPESFASDPDRVARFEREAKTLAALNHPHIAAIYGLESVHGGGSSHPPTKALVMELVEGPTLAELVGRGGPSEGSPPRPPAPWGGDPPAGEAKAAPLPMAEALAIARQIAEALEAAHEHGVVHRDLKPANVKVRDDGMVKVLDFGLAKLVAAPARPDATASPTITSPAMTQAGVILGTAAYMSPEQARGRDADRRADMWSFGCVLYEMLAGKRAFQGEDVSETLARVLMQDPDWGALPADTPPVIRRLLRRCLARDRRERLADAVSARLDIDEALAAPAGETAAARRTFAERPRWRRPVMAALAAALAAGLAGGGVAWWATRAEAPLASRLTIATSGAAALSVTNNGRDVAITPDGTRIVYIGDNASRIFVRRLDSLDPTPLADLGSPSRLFLSPDGEWIGFVSQGQPRLLRVAITGGPSVPVAPIDGLFRGATWGPDGTIVFATGAATGLQRVPASGGETAVLTTPNRERGELDHQWPVFLPDGRGVLFTIVSTTGVDNSQVAVLDMRTGAQKVLVRGGAEARYLPSGHLLYSAAGTLRAVAFDLERLEVRGTPVPVVPRVGATDAGGANFDVARNGTLVYVAGDERLDARTLVWVDRSGREELLGAPVRAYIYPQFSPDRTRLALAILDQGRDIWTWDLGQRNLTRLTTDPGEDRYPVWTPDGKRLVWDSTRSGVYNLYWQAADGTGVVERLTDSPNTQASHGFTPDGKRLVLREDSAVTGQDLAVLDLEGERRVTTLLGTPFNERNGELSPDGRWLAYESDETGRFEVYIRRFPDVEALKRQVSRDGGRQPLWSPTGRELFYRDPRGAVVGVTTSMGADAAAFGPPAILVPAGYFDGTGGVLGRTYDVSADGRRFLMIKPVKGDEEVPAPAIIVVQHWLDELKRLVPGN
jgi:serine/threonine-protein kinase